MKAIQYVLKVKRNNTKPKLWLFYSALFDNELSVSEKVVVDMTGSSMSQGCHIFCDYWCLSFRSLSFLYKNRLLAPGTIRKNRGLTHEILHLRQKKQQSDFLHKRKLFALKSSQIKRQKKTKKEV